MNPLRTLKLWFLVAALAGCFGVSTCGYIGSSGALKTERAAHKATEAERKLYAGWADRVCELVQAPFRPEKLPVKDWGASCLQRLRDAVEFKNAAIEASNAAATATIVERDEKSTRHAEAVRRRAPVAQRNQQQMETVNASVPETDRVDGAWFSALNRVAGLRPPLAPDAP